jgi:thiosulfate reductase cytochrome b subunit
MKTPQTKPGAAQSQPQERLYLHPLPVRIWHWLNAAGFLVLILTGFQLRYVDLFNLMSFETAVHVHNWVGFALIANWFLWFIYYLTSDRITNYHPDLNAANFFERFFRQAQFYGQGIFKGEKRPHDVRLTDKFNPMQKLTYQFMMFITVPITFISGLMMWDVARFEGLINAVGGIRVVNTVHVLMFIMLVLFMFVHAYMGMLGPRASTHYKEMITGYEEPHD